MYTTAPTATVSGYPRTATSRGMCPNIGVRFARVGSGQPPEAHAPPGRRLHRHWGGFVASKLWSQLIGKPGLRPRASVQRVFREALGNFELALHLARHDAEVSSEDLTAMETAVVDVFRAQERIVSDLRQTEKIHASGVQELLS